MEKAEAPKGGGGGGKVGKYGEWQGWWMKRVLKDEGGLKGTGKGHR